MSDYPYPPGINMPSDNALLFRAMASMRPVKKTRDGIARWQAVMDRFGLGSTYAHALCERFRLDPDQKVRGFRG